MTETHQEMFMFILGYNEYTLSVTLFQNGRNLSILLFTCKLALVASFNDVRAQNFPRTHFFKTLTIGKK